MTPFPCFSSQRLALENFKPQPFLPSINKGALKLVSCMVSAYYHALQGTRKKGAYGQARSLSSDCNNVDDRLSASYIHKYKIGGVL